MSSNKRIYAALAGNPNAGKTSLFNQLTGATQHVGNYPGVTVERKEGFRTVGDQEICFVDLPGLYGLSPYSEEERVAQQFLVEEKPDVIVAVVDTTNLERNLYLAAQLAEMGRPMIVAMNMSDEAETAGFSWTEKTLEQELGVEVVRTVGNRGKGVQELSDAVVRVASGSGNARRVVHYSSVLEEALGEIEGALPELRWGVSRRWAAIKLLENDEAFTSSLQAEQTMAAETLTLAAQWRKKIAAENSLPADTQLVEDRYLFVRALYKKVMRTEPPLAVTASEKIDRILTNQWLAFPMFFAIMWALFQFVFTVGAIPQDWVAAAIGNAGEWVGAMLPEGELRSLFVDGIIGGVGTVLSFLPLIVLLFFVISLLEDTGYLARVAFLMDRVMKGAGLHGKSFIPLLLGFGCNVTSVMATRTLENRSDRMITMLVSPLMSCSARLPVYVLLTSAFFPPEQAGTVMFGIYLLGVVMALSMAYFFRQTIFKGEAEPFVMELPVYRTPTLRNVLQQMWSRSMLYLNKAGTIILAASILMWFLANYPKDPGIEAKYDELAKQAQPSFVQQIKGEKKQELLIHSYAGSIGKFVEPAIQPLGFDWKIGVGLVGAFAAKEVMVGTLGTIYSLEASDEDMNGLVDAIAADPAFSPAAALSLMVFVLLYVPCLATVAVIKRESNSWKWAAFSIAYSVVLAWMAAFITYRIALLFF